MENENGNTMTVPAQSLLVTLRMKASQEADMCTVESSTESFEDIEQYLSSRELRRPYRPDSE